MASTTSTSSLQVGVVIVSIVYFIIPTILYLYFVNSKSSSSGRQRRRSARVVPVTSYHQTHGSGRIPTSSSRATISKIEAGNVGTSTNNQNSQEDGKSSNAQVAVVVDREPVAGPASTKPTIPRSVLIKSAHARHESIGNSGDGLVSVHDKRLISRTHDKLPHSASVISNATTASSTTRLMHDAPPVVLAFKDIKYSVHVKNKDKSDPFATSTSHKKEILKGINGFMKPGTLTAIMGPSGCGKTTLLDILAGRKYEGYIHGQITVNGKPRDMSVFKRISAYVMQNDCLFPFLTVREILMYTAELRISDEEASLDERTRRVEKVMEDLDLLPYADTRVGDDRSGKGLSRGQRRRVSVAIELISFPSILFLDEPTSSLDAYGSLKLVKTLRKVARRGNRTVISTIHQPRADIFTLFDNLLLMVAGQVAYFGPTEHIKAYFETIGHPIPMNINPADFIVDLTHDKDDDFYKRYGPMTLTDIENPKSVKSNISSEGPIDLLPKSPTSPSSLPPIDLGFKGHVVAREKDKENRHPHSARMERRPTTAFRHALRLPQMIDQEFNEENLLEQYKRSPLLKDNEAELETIMNGKHNLIVAINEDHDDFYIQSEEHYSSSFLYQVRTITRRSFTNNMRNPGFFVSWIVGAVSFLFYGLIYLGLRTNGSVDRGTLEFWESQRAFLFQIITAIIFLQLESLTSAFLERQMFYREHASGAYSPSAYHTSWFLRTSCHGLLRGFIFPPFVYFMSGLTITASQYFIFVLLFAIVDTIGSALALCLVSSIPSLEAASTAFTAFTSFIGTGCGFFLRPGLIPVWFIWSYYMSWYKYGLDAMYTNEFAHDVNPLSGKLVINEVFEVDEKLNIWSNALILFVFPLAFHILSFIASYLNTKPKKVVMQTSTDNR